MSALHLADIPNALHMSAFDRKRTSHQHLMLQQRSQFQPLSDCSFDPIRFLFLTSERA